MLLFIICSTWEGIWLVPNIIETSGPVRSMIGTVRLHDIYRVNFCGLKELTWRYRNYMALIDTASIGNQELLLYFVDSLHQRLDEAIFVGFKFACWKCKSNRR